MIFFQSLPNRPDYRQMTALSVEELKTLSTLYELTCHLVHLNEQFLFQFCDSVDLIAKHLLIHFLSNGEFLKILHLDDDFNESLFSCRTSNVNPPEHFNHRFIGMCTSGAARKCEARRRNNLPPECEYCDIFEE